MEITILSKIARQISPNEWVVDDVWKIERRQTWWVVWKSMGKMGGWTCAGTFDSVSDVLLTVGVKFHVQIVLDGEV